MVDTRRIGSGRKNPIYGPEIWRSDETGSWSYWDLWFCVVCFVDYGGDWAALDAAITNRHTTLGGGSGSEAKWSHMLDLRERLADAAVSAATLAGSAATDSKVITRARAKVIRQELSGKAYTSAMINTPSRRRMRRMLFGYWPRFPVSPQAAFDTLEARHGVVSRWRGEQATMSLAWKLPGSMSKLERAASSDPAELLAVRRAELTLGYYAMENCDDSCGTLGPVLSETVEAYAGTEWRSTGISPQLYWRDLLEICCGSSNYGLLHERESAVFGLAGVADDLDLAEEVLTDLHADYVEARMNWHARELASFRAYMAVAAQAFDRFERIAAILGSQDWQALEAMVSAAVKNRHPEIAQQVLAAADVPGWHQDWVRKRRVELQR